MYNAFGVVAVIIDVVGYDDDLTHDDRYELSRAVYRGQLSGRYPANSGFMLVEDSFQQPLPEGVPNLVLEYLGEDATSADCPGIGQSVVPGKLCVYAYNETNIHRAVLSGDSGGENRRYGFALDVTPSNAASNGWLLASWAYLVPER